VKTTHGDTSKMESYDLTCLRVKYSKAPYNMSQQDISQLFSGISNVNQLKELKKIVDLSCEIVASGYTNNVLVNDSRVLVFNLLTLLVEHEKSGLYDFTVRCEKINGTWHFCLGEN
jgi:hypothetical protein